MLDVGWTLPRPDELLHSQGQEIVSSREFTTARSRIWDVYYQPMKQILTLCRESMNGAASFVDWITWSVASLGSRLEFLVSHFFRFFVINQNEKREDASLKRFEGHPHVLRFTFYASCKP